MTSLRERLSHALARDANLSQAGLARATKKTTASVSNWFTGKSLSMKADSLVAAADYLRCSSQWLATGKGDPGWSVAAPSTGGVDIHPVAQELSPQSAHHASFASFQVPVIGTLAMGAENMFELRAAPAGRPIGMVPATITKAGTHAVQVFGDDLYPAIRHSACLIISTDAPCTPGELMLLETNEGHFIVCELVAETVGSVTWSPAVGGPRRTIDRTLITSMNPIVGIVPGSQLRPPSTA